jgi:uncharacterized membrane protein
MFYKNLINRKGEGTRREKRLNLQISISVSRTIFFVSLKIPEMHKQKIARIRKNSSISGTKQKIAQNYLNVIDY